MCQWGDRTISKAIIVPAAHLLIPESVTGQPQNHLQSQLQQGFKPVSILHPMGEEIKSPRTSATTGLNSVFDEVPSRIQVYRSYIIGKLKS